MRHLLAAVLALHGLIHLMGAAKGFGLAALPQLRRPIAPAAGAAWLAASVLLLVAGGLAAARSRGWWIPALGGAVLSQVLIITGWQDAKWGSVANVLVALAILALSERGW